MSSTEDFLLKEYERISEAHFNTSDQISSFFRYYLTLMSVPALLLLYIDKNMTTIEKIFTEKNYFLNPYIGWLCLTIAAIGTLITIFLTKLKFERILYARTVNGIRNYFHKKDPTLKQFLVLPTNQSKPSFLTTGYGSLVAVNAIVNSAYLGLGLYFLNFPNCYIFTPILFCSTIIVYMIMSKTEENKVINLRI